MAKDKKTEDKESAAQAAIATEGHNSKPGVNPALQKIFTDVESLETRKKEIGKAIRDLKLEAKEKHAVPVQSFNHELKLRRMEEQSRREFEHNNENLKHMLGYQFALPLAGEGERIEDEVDPVENAKKEKLKAVK